MDEKLKLRYDLAICASLVIIICLCALLYNQSQLVDKLNGNIREIVRICQDEAIRAINSTRVSYG